MSKFIKLIIVLALIAAIIFGAIQLIDRIPSSDRLLGLDKPDRNTYDTGKGNEEYIVTFYTADVSGGGTNANVSVIIYGDERYTSKLEVNSYIGNFAESAFEAGDTDQLTVKAEDVGNITSVEISSDQAGAGSAWDLQYLKILKDGKEYFFFPNNTLGGGYPTNVILQPSMPADYTFTIKTADVRTAGTDSDTYFELIGTDGSMSTTEVTDLLSNFGYDNPLERDTEQTFTLSQVKGVGELTQLRVRGDGWNVDYIDVEVRYQDGTTYKIREDFDDNVQVNDDQWISGTPINVESSGDYIFTIKTADVRTAGTDSDTYFELSGTDGSIGTTEVTDLLSDFGYGNPLERDTEQTFTLNQMTGVGEPTTLRVRGDGWNVDYIDVEVRYQDGTTYKKRADFDDNVQINDDQWKLATLTDLGTASGNALLVLPAPLLVLPAPVGAYPPHADYTFTIQTATVRGAGTDSDTYFELIGPDGSMKTTEVTDLVSEAEAGRYGNPLENGDLESFTLNGIKGVGEPTELRVQGNGWHVNYIDVEVRYQDGTTYRKRADFDDNKEVEDDKWVSATLTDIGSIRP